jgi:hypothetical protein
MAVRVKKAATDQTFYFMLVDSAAGTPESDYTISNLDITYVRDRAAATKADATALSSITVAHADNKAFQVSKTTAPGLYRVDFPDAAFSDSATVDRVQLLVTGTGLAPAVLEVELVKYGISDIYEAISDVYSDTTHIDSDLTAISDTISDLMVKIDSDALLYQSDMSDVRSSLTVITAIVSDVQSDTNYMVPIVSDIQSDTAVLVTMAAKYTSDVTKTPLSNLATAVAASDIKSNIVLVHSETTALQVQATNIYSDTAAIITKADSDMVLLAADHDKTQSDIDTTTAAKTKLQL